ncbi:tetratricopeptide repeat protein [Roseixanthobacter glucoisosaccharinicivorans]|uniref:tetratricopeptide repeat-containing glycosyltransferase family protein n=1 Tax=Roseixanthobacter glucoisosaccharinicivorans TaxID=3119923 RepID=UPI003727285C
METIDEAIAAHRSGDLILAESLYRRVLEREPLHFDALHLLGVIAAQHRRYEEAEYLMRGALHIEPDDLTCLRHHGNVLARLGRNREAQECFDRALALAPDDPAVLSDRGAALHVLGRYAEAADDFRAALRCDPSHGDAHLRLGASRLLHGDFAGGWVAFGSRRWDQEERRVQQAGGIDAPIWRGDEPLMGRTILLQGRHGFGDTLQFCRYVPMVAALGARVILEVPPSIAGLMASLGGGAIVLPAGAERPSFDTHCSLLSLPFAFRTMLDTIPVSIPYLYPPSARIAAWARALGRKRRPRVGIAWSGGGNRNDPRAADLSAFLSLRSLDIDLVVLQKDTTPAEREVLAVHPDVLYPAGDFLETAALGSLMDLVISVDTAIAHLGGALGVPTFVLLPVIPDWRWLLNREDSPWYPTMRLFRQREAGDWDSSFAAIRHELSVRFGLI